MTKAAALLKEWYPRLDRPLRAALWLLLCVWLGWLIASWIWWLVAGPVLPVTDSPFEQVVANEPLTTPRLAVPEQWHFFGVPGEAAVVAQADAPAPDTRLRLELVGLFFHQDIRQGSAIISAEGKEAELYQVEDTIPGSNATLAEVHADRVILLRAGQRETLRLQELRTPAGMTSSVPVAPSRPTVQRQLRTIQPRQPGEEPESLDALIQAGAESVQLRQQAISQLGLASLGDEQGYRIGARASQGLLQSVGLRPGDIVKSVNGHLLGEESSDLAALEEFRASGTATIVVQRGSQEITVNFPP